MKSYIFCLPLLLCTVSSGALIHLNDDNFEHLTQAATGATTGDWLVFMVPDEKTCKTCETAESLLTKIAENEEFHGRINVAKLLQESSPLTLRRFRIKKEKIMYFRLGRQWVYNGGLNFNSLANFLKQGFSSQKSKPVVKPIDRLDYWKEDFVKELKAAIKERRIPEKNVLLVLVGGVLLVLMLIPCMMPSKPKDKDKKKK